MGARPILGPAGGWLRYNGKNTVPDARRICHLPAASLGQLTLPPGALSMKYVVRGAVERVTTKQMKSFFSTTKPSANVRGYYTAIWENHSLLVPYID